ncbi:alpha/beta fold hydrolase [Celerinatantimonas sp. MCCC 1A17872]|uniref:alpha/beta fold hydrolase n=1 Tax=Celerinatantimonas sp. MCCC 1A17872 TaxID=3177514 RepID=UPI0038C4030E
MQNIKFNEQQFWQQFSHGVVRTQMGRMHYVSGGHGSTVLLLPGWPQSWYAWRYLMPILANSGKRVVALDLPGMGDSDHPDGGYDSTSIALTLRSVIKSIATQEKDGIEIIAHDVGAWMGYALASDHPDCVKKLVLMDAAIPGLSTLPSGELTDEQVMRTWHFAFNRLNDLPEILIKGREEPFLQWLFSTKAEYGWMIDEKALAEYVRVNRLPGALRSALSYYRHAFSKQDIEINKLRAKNPLLMPVLTIGAQYGVSDLLYNTLSALCTDIRGEVIQGVGHYLPEESPLQLGTVLNEFLS